MKPKTRKPKAAPDPWQVLVSHITAYRDAAITESWKGGGDPSEYETLELRLKLARVELNNHIAYMKKELE